jgi:hypothetical protein
MPVKLVLLNSSVVILAKAHNPTILHPSFLSAQGIVPSDWELAENPICTPAISVVKYANNVVFTAELNKLMIRQDDPSADTPVRRLALAYVEKLPHVTYSAVGVNFAAFIERPTPAQWVIDRFLSKGPGNDEKLKPDAVGLKFVYPVEGGRLNLGCDAGTIQNAEKKTTVPALIINANYDTPVSGHSIEETKNAISLFDKRLVHFTEITDSVFGLIKTHAHAR